MKERRDVRKGRGTGGREKAEKSHREKQGEKGKEKGEEREEEDRRGFCL